MYVCVGAAEDHLCEWCQHSWDDLCLLCPLHLYEKDMFNETIIGLKHLLPNKNTGSTPMPTVSISPKFPTATSESATNVDKLAIRSWDHTIVHILPTKWCYVAPRIGT